MDSLADSWKLLRGSGSLKSPPQTSGSSKCPLILMHLGIAQELKWDAFVGRYTKKSLLVLPNTPASAAPAETSDHQMLTWTQKLKFAAIAEIVISFSENLSASPEKLKLRGMKIKASSSCVWGVGEVGEKNVEEERWKKKSANILHNMTSNFHLYPSHLWANHLISMLQIPHW